MSILFFSHSSFHFYYHTQRLDYIELPQPFNTRDLFTNPTTTMPPKGRKKRSRADTLPEGSTEGRAGLEPSEHFLRRQASAAQLLQSRVERLVKRLAPRTLLVE